MSPKKILVVKDKWVKVRVTMDSRAAGHVMPETMFPHVKLERKTHRRSLWQQMESKSKTWVRRAFHSRQKREFRGTTFRSANVVKSLISMQKVVRAGNIVVLDEKNPHIRNTRDGTVIKLDVNNGVYTMDIWICFDETGPVLSWQGL